MLHFLFSFKGRVNRAKFWAFYLGSTLVVGMPIVVLIGLDILFAKVTHQPSVIDGTWPAGPTGWILVILYAILGVVYSYALLAIIVKRLHDRGKSAWWLAFYFGVTVALCAGVPELYNPARFPSAYIITMLAFFAGWLISAWLMIELLFIPGTRGANRFGPDPRAKPDRIDRPQGGA